MMREIEIKYGVADEKSLQALEQCAAKLFPQHALKEVVQNNFFFDTTDFAIRKKKLGARLRKEDDRYYVTLKGPSGASKSKSAAVTNRLEFETEITDREARALQSGKKDLFALLAELPIADKQAKRTRDHLLGQMKEECGHKAVQIIGSFTNLRRILPVAINGDPMKLEFDRTRYNEHEKHYEVELEIPSLEKLAAAEQFLDHLFGDCGVGPIKTKSKSERFYSFLNSNA